LAIVCHGTRYFGGLPAIDPFVMHGMLCRSGPLQS
jgi:hypothetical protein